MEIEKAIEYFKNEKLYSDGFWIEQTKYIDLAISALEKQKLTIELLERAREEIQNCYGKDTELTKDISEFLEDCEVSNE